MNQVELTIPARQDMLLVARMALSGVCVRCGLTLDAVEDARLAVDEAYYCLTHQRIPAEWLRMLCDWDAARLDVLMSVKRETAPARIPPPNPNQSNLDELAQCILETLVSSARLTGDEFGVHTIRMQINCENAVEEVPDSDG
ncbi:hypothetical protein AGMMS49992_05090 [Clostridia bacterium]|nr:hypothetical protein AGMMS49992_05090 [Clostridia bacterium]